MDDKDIMYQIEAEKQKLGAGDGNMHAKKFGAFLVERRIITDEQLQAALCKQRKLRHVHLGTILVNMGCMEEKTVGRVLASQLKTPFLRLEDVSVGIDVIALIDGELARRHSCMPLYMISDRVVLAMGNPFDLAEIDELEKACGLHVEAVGALPSEIAKAIERNYPFD